MTAPPPLPAAIIGFGKQGQGYADDPVMARHYRYAVHAQVMAEHPGIDWRCVVDPAPEALAAARDRWGVPACAASARELGEIADSIELAVIATGPEARLDLIDAFPALRAVLVEKPLGRTLAEGQAFLDACAARGIAVQVNLWRRADAALRALAAGGLAEAIGTLQGATMLYGNGLVNNGTHMIDMARMLFGEPLRAHLLGLDAGFVEGPIPGDRNPRFALTMTGGAVVDFMPVRFAEWRENGLIAWGTQGRLDVLNEGLSLATYPRIDNRAMQGEGEIAHDRPSPIAPTAGTALWAMHDNLLAALAGHAELVSPGASALATARVVEAVARLTPEAPLAVLA